MIEEIIDYNKPVTVILDANAYVHSSFHAYEPRIDRKGLDQRVLHGLMDTLVGLTYQLERIDEIFLVFDPIDGSLYRKSLFPSYKAHRPEKDVDLLRQSEDAQKVLKNIYGLPIITHAGYEADDIIGSLSKITSENSQTVIVSPDKDLAQLVNDNVFLLRKNKSKNNKGYDLLNSKRVFEKFGVMPDKIADYLTLVGDTVDGLPGLKNVGPKTAVKIISKYLSIEHLLSLKHHLDDEKLKTKLLEVEHSLPLIKQLASIVCNLDLYENINTNKSHIEKIRSENDYKNKLIMAEKYFNLQPYYKDLFIN